MRESSTPFHLIDAKIADREFVIDTIWCMLEGSDLTFDIFQACINLLDVYDDVEEFAYDRLSDEETNELLEDVGSNTLLEIALDRLVDGELSCLTIYETVTQLLYVTSNL